MPLATDTTAVSPLSRAASLWPEPVALKVPEITFVFWLIKVVTTGTGEAASDFLADHNLVIAGGVAGLGLSAALVHQLRRTRYAAGAYWLTVSMVAVFGTMAADALHVVLGLSYVVTSTGYGLMVAAVFLLWYRVEGTLDIHSVTTRRRELFYWAAVLSTFALGTAVSDLSATTEGFGFLPSAILYGLVMGVPVLLWQLGVNPVMMFWAAYVVTRPLGASIADWLGKPVERTGLGFGDGPVTLVSVALLVVLVVWQSRRTAGSAVGPRGPLHTQL